jgi:DNA-binding NarL/FixJ family response regulator
VPERRARPSQPVSGEPTAPAIPESAGSGTRSTALTPRQREILFQVAHGRTNRQIGEALGISERTVRNHMRTIMHKLSSTDRTNAVVIAIGRGWIPIPIEPEAAAAPEGAAATVERKRPRPG